MALASMASSTALASMAAALHKCHCVIGWRGHDCEIDINECDELSDALGWDNNACGSKTPASVQQRLDGNDQVDGGCFYAGDYEFAMPAATVASAPTANLHCVF